MTDETKAYIDAIAKRLDEYTDRAVRREVRFRLAMTGTFQIALLSVGAFCGVMVASLVALEMLKP